MAPKRARTSGTSSSRQPPNANEPPQWGNKPLSSLPNEWQPRLYQEKMRAMKNVGDTFIAERHVYVDDFRGYGLIEGMERLGWLGALTINSDGESLVYPDETIQWMASLQREDGTHPPWTTTLTGMVNGAIVRLSFDSLRQIIDVDTLPREDYQVVNTGFIRTDVVRPEDYEAMLEEIFDAPAHVIGDQSPLHVRYLKPLPRLLYKILTWNIVPRLSDKAKVRTADLRPMFAILTGRVRFPFFQLVVANIWESRESSKKMVIPHCRLITALLKNSGAITRNSRSTAIAATPFDRAHLNKPDFRFKETLTHYVLRDDVTKRVQQIPKPAEAEPAEGGDAEDEERGEYEHYGGREGIRAYPNRPVGYENWSPYERTMYDRQEFHWEQQQQFNDHTHNRLSMMEQNIDVMAYYQQKYQHELFEYTEQTRHHHDYISGLPYQPTPPPRDYSTMAPFEAQSPSQLPVPYPGMAQPQWWGGYQQSQRSSDQASSSAQPPDAPDPFDMRPLARGLFEDFFGQRYP